MKQRPIVVATIGYILGIIMGLYLKSIVLLYILIVALVINKYLIHVKKKRSKFKLFSLKRYFRYIKISFNITVIIIIIVTSFLGNKYVTIKQKEYEEIYDKLENSREIEAIGVISSNKVEKENKDRYEIKIISINGLEIKNKKFYCYIKKKQNQNIKYGNLVKITGKYQRPPTQRNQGGFNYSSYLKTKSIYGIIQVNKIHIKEENVSNIFFKKANDIREKIIKKSNNLNEEKKAIFLGLIIGETSSMEDNTKEAFKKASMSHILAVSGMHIAFLILFSIKVLSKIFGKKLANILTIIVIIMYMFISGFSASVVRAGVMGIILLISNVIYRKNDIYTSIATSLLIILTKNPFMILDIGLQLSYMGTIGIILFNKRILILLKKIKIKDKKIRYKIPIKIIKITDKIKEMISVILSAQIGVLPISIYHFNIFSPYFLITNFLTSLIVELTYIIGILYTLFIFIDSKIVILFQKILEIGIEIIIQITKIPQKLPFSKIYLATPKITYIIFYYIFMIVIFYIIDLKNRSKLNMSQKRIIYIVAVAKFKYKNLNKRYLFIFILIFFSLNYIIPRNLKINFIDVGQGDSTFIVTPRNKTILIDGGGSMSKEFDVGKNTLIPYILDKGFTKIDYVLISHFDQDHVGGILTLLEELKVKKVFIAKQGENSDNYKKFLNIIKQKKVDVKIVRMGEKINIEKNILFEIIFPENKLIKENTLNNNSIVTKLKYKDFSCLFTGDIEKIAEQEILKQDNLKSTILKVAHHGSKTSSTFDFLKRVKPKVALIGVGKDNSFGHPSEETIENLTKIKSEIYRTDENGEINIYINKRGKIKIKKHIN